MIEKGDIVLLKNICFFDGKIDHAFNSGRLCIYLGELNERMYFIALANASNEKQKFLRKIYPNKENNLKKVSRPNIHSLIEKPIAFYEVHGRLSDKDLNRVFLNIKSYYKVILKKQDEIFLELASNYFNKQKFYDSDAIIINKAK